MRLRSALLIVIIALALVSGACGGGDQAQPILNALNLRQVFDAEASDGTIVVQPLQGDDPALVYNLDRARVALPPAETFRPLAMLILLETGNVESLDTEYSWNREGPYVQDWDRVHSLRSGADPKANAEWLYVQTIEDTGLDIFEVWLSRAAYGNQNVRGGTGQFWRDGTLLITAQQQADFMALLFSEAHPFEHYAALDAKDLMLRTQGNGWTLRYVQGTVPGPRTSDKVGWLVGVVETDEGRWAIGMNTDIDWDRTLDPDKRLRITQNALIEAGIIGGG